MTKFIYSSQSTGIVGMCDNCKKFDKMSAENLYLEIHRRSGEDEHYMNLINAYRSKCVAKAVREKESELSKDHKKRTTYLNGVIKNQKKIIDDYKRHLQQEIAIADYKEALEKRKMENRRLMKRYLFDVYSAVEKISYKKTN